MIALIRRWLKHRRNSQCAVQRHYWKVEKGRAYCTNCGTSIIGMF